MNIIYYRCFVFSLSITFKMNFILEVSLSYTPVAIMHGLGASASDVKYIGDSIEEMYPGIYVNRLTTDPRL